MTHILKCKQFVDKDLLNKIFTKAMELEKADINEGMPKTLAGKIVATLFYEPSTRTRLSFEASAIKLGAGVISTENAIYTSSQVKGESLEDTIRTVNCYADIIVLRHSEPFTSERASQVSSVPIINAGDGGNEHPTQAVYDLWTVYREMGRLDNLKIVVGFDPKHSRTIRSFVRLLAIFENNKFIFVCPQALKPNQDLLQDLVVLGVNYEIKFTMDSIGDADVLYINRLQEERFENRQEFETNRLKFVLTPEHLKNSKAIILNPLPRIDEIAIEVDKLPNAKYFQQAKNGLYIRSALLLYALNY